MRCSMKSQKEQSRPEGVGHIVEYAWIDWCVLIASEIKDLARFGTAKVVILAGVAAGEVILYCSIRCLTNLLGIRIGWSCLRVLRVHPWLHQIFIRNTLKGIWFLGGLSLSHSEFLCNQFR